ncbi:probable uridine nucleosidase 1 [Zootermopsis nevadensis]|nr:probable uridine nucleosidase 1 [Zootermopsis nevadensis]
MNRFNLLVINSALAIFMHVVTGRYYDTSRGRRLKTEQCYHTKFPQLDAGKVIIDTDAGADDAAAIFMAINKEKDNSSFKVIAITCVHGNTAVDNVVVNVFKILQTVGRLDIPVYRGASKSFIWTPPSDNYFGEDGFGDFEFPNPPNSSDLLQNEHAVNSLIQIVTQNPGEVTLLCLGPLTNVALAVRMDPTFLTKLKHLVVLGGSTEGVGNIKPGIEFNFYVDPEAAFIVFNSSDTSTGHIRPITLVPYDSVSERNIVTMVRRSKTYLMVCGSRSRSVNIIMQPINLKFSQTSLLTFPMQRPKSYFHTDS